MISLSLSESQLSCGGRRIFSSVFAEGRLAIFERCRAALARAQTSPYTGVARGEKSRAPVNAQYVF